MTNKSALRQCSMSLHCKSKDCHHAKPHKSNGCDGPAPCGAWPNNPGFQPTVMCIPVEHVIAPADCPNCGKSEAKGHHPQDCIIRLKTRIKELEAALIKVRNRAEIYLNDDAAMPESSLTVLVDICDKALSQLGKEGEK